MSTLIGFDATQVEPLAPRDAIPAGWYVAIIIDSGSKANSAGNGSFIQLVFEIQEGEYTGRLQWVRLNLDHPNSDAVRLARAELSAICRAAGVLQPNDTEDLHNLPLRIRVELRKRGDTGAMVNEVREFRPLDPPTPSNTADAINSTPPWARDH